MAATSEIFGSERAFRQTVESLHDLLRKNPAGVLKYCGFQQIVESAIHLHPPAICAIAS